MLTLTAALLLLASTTPAGAPRPEATHLPAPGHTGDGSHAPRGHGPGGTHGNPSDLSAYSAGLVDPSRDAWQRPDDLVKALALRPGQVACDVGAGPGYFTLRLATAVGAAGRVLAVDVESALLDALRNRIGSAGIRNVTPVLSLPDDPLLPASACDVVLVVNTYHHFPDGPAMLRKLVAALKPGGRIVNVDFHKRETGFGPPVAHRVAREAFLADAAGAGLELVAEPTFLPHQYFLVLAPKPAR